MVEINVNFDKVIGKIKAMHGVGQPPLSGTNTDYFRYLKEANIPYSRLHDVGGWFGGNMWVDIPNIFRDFDADVNDPNSYDFTFTDILIKGLYDNNCQPIYRLGVTIENFHEIKSYRIFPPKDMKKWAVICEHIIRHYNEGWANGFFYGIKYWEIWNEPDGHYKPEKNAMWKGTKEEYFELYKVTSTHLRACFGNSIKIGGYSSCGFYAIGEKTEGKLGAIAMGERVEITDWDDRILSFVRFFHSFMEFAKENNLPLDFFSYHSYASLENTIQAQAYVEKELIKYGYSDTEIHLNEWNMNVRWREIDTSKPASINLALMCTMQNTKMELMCYYDARMTASVYGGLFSPVVCEPRPTYFSFKAFGKLYEMGNQIEILSSSEKVYVLGAKSLDKKGLIIVNLGDDTEIKTNINEDMVAYVIDDDKKLEKIDLNINNFVCKKDCVIYLEK